MSPLFRSTFIVLCCFLVTIVSAIPLAKAQSDELSAKLSEAQIEQLVAPIALYPDDLLAQLLMASTYPLEIVQAARWVDKNKNLKGKTLEAAIQRQSWDESIKSVALVPQVLTMMNEELDWTQQLGDAFLVQQEDVLEAVQRLRRKAENEGNLKSNKQQKIVKKTVEKQEVIIVQSANPEIVYVPVYNPTVIYGTWPYPSYVPYYYYPPGYVASRAIWFGAGVAVGAAIWGNCNWGRYNVEINVNRYNNFNRTDLKNVNWNHNSFHRKGVPYRDASVRKKYNRNVSSTKAREEFRGRTKSGTSIQRKSKPIKKQDLARKKDVQKKRPPRTSGKSRPKTSPKKRTVSNKRRPPSKSRTTRRPSAYDDIGRSKKVKKYSSRGKSSRRASAQRSSRSRGGNVRRRR